MHRPYPEQLTRVVQLAEFSCPMPGYVYVVRASRVDAASVGAGACVVATGATAVRMHLHV